MAVGALQALREADLRVPRDLAVVGFDALESYAATWPTLSTVEQPTADLGRTAVAALLDRIERPDGPPFARWLPTRLLLRGSCGCAAGARAIAGDRGAIDTDRELRTVALAAAG
jgi:LacI family transcriptional regulator